MPEVTAYATGQPTWADVTTTDVPAAAAFYGGLFGWEAQTDPRPEAGGYTMFRRARAGGGRDALPRPCRARGNGPVRGGRRPVGSRLPGIA